MTPAVIGLGANIGHPVAALRGAIEALDRHPDIALISRSSIYETDPVGGPDQPRYLNAVALIETELEPVELLRVTQSIEQDWHRTRDVHWGPRTLDLDIIAMGENVRDDPELVLPHPRAHVRAFVLIPWLEIEPSAALPGIGPMRDVIGKVDVTGVERTSLGWV